MLTSQSTRTPQAAPVFEALGNKMDDGMELSVGDWVRSYSAGIWQIYKILNYNCINPINGEIQSKTTIFSKRFLSNSFKRSFKQESCDPLLVRKLHDSEQKKLDEFIINNPELYKKFVDLKIKDIDCIYNARISVPAEKSIEEVTDILQSDNFIKDTEISKYLSDLGFSNKQMPFWTVQFVSPDFHCINGHLVFKFNRVLEF